MINKLYYDDTLCGIGFNQVFVACWRADRMIQLLCDIHQVSSTAYVIVEDLIVWHAVTEE